MKYIGKTLLLFMVLAFTLNATTGFAAGMCGCDHPESQMMEVPCHNAEASDSVSADDGENNKTAQCTMCKCGHCKSHSQMSLGHNASSPDVQSSRSSMSVHTDVLTSLIIYGIDNPPKHIS